MRRLLFSAIFRFCGLCLLLSSIGASCAAACPEMDSDPHFHKVYENEVARVYTLELGRIESTTSYCQEHPYFYLVTSESQTLDTQIGHAGWSHTWNSGEARFVTDPNQHAIRNETATTHHALIVEILTKPEYNLLARNLQIDDFSGDLGSAKPTWTISTEHGPMSAVKTQIGPGDKLEVSGRTRLIVALNDLSLVGLGKAVNLRAQDVQVISPASDFVLTNTTQFPAKFVSIAF